MAVVLPQGRFNNSSDKYIRDYITERCRILAVVGLHNNVFKPHTGTKTSVLFVQKWTDENCGFPNICPKPKTDKEGKLDYPIFFATMQEPSKNNSGDKIYVTENYVTWTSYTHINEEVIIRKTDKMKVNRKEYEQAEKKSAYKIETIRRVIPNEHLSADGTPRFIKDLFIEQNGPLDSHKKWILKSSKYVIKNKNANPDKVEEISIADYFKLDKDTARLYKEVLVAGKNTNPLISLEQYNNLSPNEKKMYLVAEDVKEWSERIKDTHGHFFVKHDLFNHDSDLPNSNPKNIYSQNGIAEAFAKFAYDEGLSFAPTGKELKLIMHPENEHPF